jgi:hypothetical protein
MIEKAPTENINEVVESHSWWLQHFLLYISSFSILLMSMVELGSLIVKF